MKVKKMNKFIIFDGSKETACFNPLMEIPDSTVPEALHVANKMALAVTEGFSEETQNVFTASFLIVGDVSIGSGKTTFANAVLRKMLEYTPNDSFYIVDDMPELQCPTKDKTFLSETGGN